MELERLKYSWYTDGYEALLRLYFGSLDGGPYLVEVIRPRWERYTHNPQQPAPGEPLICTIPRLSFEERETVRVRVKTVPGDGPSVILWEAEVQASEVRGEPHLKVLTGEDVELEAA